MTTAYSARSIRRRGSKMDGKKLPLRSLGMRNPTSPACVDNSRGRAAVAIGDPGVGAFVAGGADLLGGFGLDQLLQHQLHSVTHQVDSPPARNASSRSDRTDLTGPSWRSPS